MKKPAHPYLIELGAEIRKIRLQRKIDVRLLFYWHKAVDSQTFCTEVQFISGISNQKRWESLTGPELNQIALCSQQILFEKRGLVRSGDGRPQTSLFAGQRELC
jgi:hypothetical protein